ncbi:MAG: extensin family protein [Myxococcota bacterium]
MMRPLYYMFFVTFCSVAAAGCAPPSASGPVEWAGDRPAVVDDPYPLDGESRRAPGKKEPVCPHVQLVLYAGDVVPYHRPLKVSPFFRERLQRFEEVVRAVSIEVYDRPPASIRHFGAYNCRRVRGTSHLSEHALGNAIDVSGFTFAADPMTPGPRGGAFTIWLEEHWDKRKGFEGTHARFLRALTERLAARPDIFRGIIGPGAPGHDDHFHLDVGARYTLKVER